MEKEPLPCSESKLFRQEKKTSDLLSVSHTFPHIAIDRYLDRWHVFWFTYSKKKTSSEKKKTFFSWIFKKKFQKKCHKLHFRSYRSIPIFTFYPEGMQKSKNEEKKIKGRNAPSFILFFLSFLAFFYSLLLYFIGISVVIFV